MSWDNKRKKQFREALQDVYRSHSQLQMFVSDALGENLEGVAGRSDLQTTAFNLVDWLESRGMLDAFCAAFCEENPHHEFARSGRTSGGGSVSGASGAAPGTSPGTVINTQGGDYSEVNVSGGMYAGRDIDNRTENKQYRQQGINANDSASVTINNYYASSSVPEGGKDMPEPPEPPDDRDGFEEMPDAIEQPYVLHRAIEGVCKAALTQPGSLVRIKAPHRFGKTELISQLRQFAEGEEGYKVVVLDLCRVEAPSLESLDNFLRWFCKRIAKRLRVYKDRPLEDYWDTDPGCSNSSCSDYIEEAILENLNEPLVLALDNVDALFERQAIVLEFFKLLRSWYEAARREPEWRKLRLILAHATEPYEFLKVAESHHSPFNVGEPIELPAFDRERVSELVARFGLAARVDLARLYEMLDGHPELLQIGLKFLRLDRGRTLDVLQIECGKFSGVFSSHLGGLEALLRKSGHLALMRRVAKSAEPFAVSREKADRDAAVALVRFGLVREVGDRCIVPRCGLYRQHFRDLA